MGYALSEFPTNGTLVEFGDYSAGAGIEKVYGVFCILKAAMAIWIAKLDMNVYPLLPPKLWN